MPLSGRADQTVTFSGVTTGHNFWAASCQWVGEGDPSNGRVVLQVGDAGMTVFWPLDLFNDIGCPRPYILYTAGAVLPVGRCTTGEDITALNFTETIDIVGLHSSTSVSTTPVDYVNSYDVSAAGTWSITCTLE